VRVRQQDGHVSYIEAILCEGGWGLMYKRALRQMGGWDVEAMDSNAAPIVKVDQLNSSTFLTS